MSKKDKTDISRRDFLKKGAILTATAAAGAGILAGCEGEAGKDGKDGKDAEAGSGPGNTSIDWDLTFDVIVVGGGGAGLASAIEAASAGAKVILLEKREFIGGSTALSGGVVQASDTKYQDEFNITGDTASKHYEYWILAGEDSVDEQLVNVLANNSGPDFEWVGKLGAAVTDIYRVDPIPYVSEDLMLGRLHVVDGGGAGYISVLQAKADSLGVDIRFSAAASKLYYDETDGILGLMATLDGKETNIQAAKAVILACGGYDRNEELAKAYSPQLYWDLQNGLALASQDNTGDGLKMGMAIGADLAGMGGAISYPAVHLGRADKDFTPLPGIWINKYGQRFVNEATHYGYASRAVFDQEEHIAWAIFDETVKEIGGATLGGWSDDLSAEIDNGTIITGSTIEEFAQALGVNAAMLELSLQKWNDDMDGDGEDTLFGRTTGLQALSTAPYYAVRVLSYNVGSCGGLKINKEAQVIDLDGNVINRLYAAGMVTGGFIGPYYPGSGTAVAATLVFGRIAGKNAAAETTVE